MQKIRPPVKWHGGKYYMSHHIIKCFPPHKTYVEPYGGGASVLLNKIPANVEIYNDLNSRITRLFRVIRDHGEEFQKRLSLTPYSNIEFDLAIVTHEDEIEQARRDFVRWRQSIGGRGDSFSLTKHRSRRQMADVVSGYLSAIDEQLPLIIDRLSTVQLLCRPALEIIKKWDSKDTLHYLDPPYVHNTRSSPGVYDLEMTDEDHRDLAKVLQKCVGKVVLSGYPSELYNRLYSAPYWRTISFDLPNNAAGGRKKNRQQETLWLNF